MRRTASDRDRTPAASAAATSPTLCPIVIDGRIPTSASARTLADWIANIIGCATCVCASSLLRLGDASSLVSDQPDSGAKCESISVERVAEGGIAAIGGAPHSCPLRAVAREDKDDGPVAFDRAPANGVGVAHGRTAQIAKAPTRDLRDSCAAHHQTLAHALSSVIRRRHDSAAFGSRRPRRSGARTDRRAPAGPRRSAPTASGAAARARTPRDTRGGSAMTTCALVPPNPKELTPAKRRSPVPRQGRRASRSRPD